jgi:hypothetical protein
MYRVDERDTVAELTGFPFPCVAETDPQLCADEHELVLAYRIDGPREWRMSDEGEEFAVVRFEEPHLHQFGWFTADGLFRMRHFVFVFHRRTLECVAMDCTFSVHPGPLSAVRAEMLRHLFSP